MPIGKSINPRDTVYKSRTCADCVNPSKPNAADDVAPCRRVALSAAILTNQALNMLRPIQGFKRIVSNAWLWCNAFPSLIIWWQINAWSKWSIIASYRYPKFPGKRSFDTAVAIQINQTTAVANSRMTSHPESEVPFETLPRRFFERQATDDAVDTK